MCRLTVTALLTGIITGLVDLACIHLFHRIQTIVWDVRGGILLEAVSAVPSACRVGILTLVDVVGAPSWLLLLRRNTAATSVSGAVGETPIPPLCVTWHVLTQVLIVDLGASVGREVAPREVVAASSTAAVGRLGLTPEGRRIVVACGTGAGLIAVYSTPLSGTIYTLEILLVSLSTHAVALALATSGITVLVSTGFTRPTFFYTVPTLTPSLSSTVFGTLVGPVLGAAGRAFKETAARAGAIRPHGWRIPVILPFTFVIVGLVSTRVPSVLGNGQTSTCFLHMSPSPRDQTMN